MIYFIRPEGMRGPVKIGTSNNPAVRLAALMAWSPFRLEIAAQMPGYIWEERALHQKFIDSHTHGEWFDWTPELEAVIDEVRAGTFSIAELPHGYGQPCLRRIRQKTAA